LPRITSPPLSCALFETGLRVCAQVGCGMTKQHATDASAIANNRFRTQGAPEPVIPALRKVGPRLICRCFISFWLQVAPARGTPPELGLLKSIL
jgi:hypothetical protein